MVAPPSVKHTACQSVVLATTGTGVGATGVGCAATGTTGTGTGTGVGFPPQTDGLCNGAVEH